MTTIIIHPTEDKIEVTCRINMNEKKKRLPSQAVTSEPEYTIKTENPSVKDLIIIDKYGWRE